MLRASELSVTAASPQTAFSRSSFPISFPWLRSRTSSTRKALGSTAKTSPALTIENSCLANLNLGESENKRLTRHHNSIIRIQKEINGFEKLIKSPP